MSKPSAVLWDVGGTLVVYAMSADQFLQRCLKPVGLSIAAVHPESLRQAYQDLRRQQRLWRTLNDERQGYLQVTEQLLEGIALSSGAVEQVAQSLSDYFAMYQLVPGVVPILEELASYGIMQGVVSNWQPSLRRFLKHHGLIDYFSTVVCSAEHGIEKPDPTMFQLAIEELGVRPADCVFVGDNPAKDIAPARSLGMRTVHFNPRRDLDTSDATEASALWVLLRLMLDVRRDSPDHEGARQTMP